MKTAIIGIDGADWNIIEPLLRAGHLPTLKRLIDTGCRGTLKSTIPPNSAPAWSSMITGVNPGKHGIFDFTMNDANYRRVPLDIMNHLGVPPIWRLLNASGISTGIVNLPILYPPEPVQGFSVCGMTAPWSARVFTYPESLSQMIGSLKEKWIISEHLSRGDRLDGFREEIRQKTAYQAEVVVKLLDQIDTAFLMIVFDGSDKAQHFFWKYWDLAHPRYDPRAAENLKSMVSDFYIDVDRHLARILEKFGEGNVFIVSDHGFTALAQYFFIERWLLEQGYLHFKSPVETTFNQILGAIISKTWRAAARLRPLRKKIKPRGALDRIAQRTRDTLQESNMRFSGNIDWSKTRAFFGGISSYAIRINVQGRDKLGIVNKSEEYNHLVRELKERLLQVSDPANHSQVIRQVYHRDEIYAGPKVGDAPDLVVEAQPGYAPHEGYPNHLLGPSIVDGRDRCGGHRPEGIFIANGPDVKMLEGPIEANILDVMPTIMYLNHLPVPRYVDGNVIAPVIQDNFKAAHAVEYTDVYATATPTSDGYSEEERAEVEEHLKALGYF